MKEQFITNIKDDVIKLNYLKKNEQKPIIVAIDGYSASGKSSLSKKISTMLSVKSVIIEGDDFYRVMNNEERLNCTPEQGISRFFDWQRLAKLFKSLIVGTELSYKIYNWNNNCLDMSKKIEVPEIILLEGVYSSRCELSEFIDYHILVETPQKERLKRQLDRNQNTNELIKLWAKSEDLYFKEFYSVKPNTRFNGYDSQEFEDIH